MAGITEILSSVPQPVQWALAGVGAYVIASRVLSYVQLVLELFVLSGTNVSDLRTIMCQFSRADKILFAAPQVWS